MSKKKKSHSSSSVGPGALASLDTIAHVVAIGYNDTIVKHNTITKIISALLNSFRVFGKRKLIANDLYSPVIFRTTSGNRMSLHWHVAAVYGRSIREQISRIIIRDFLDGFADDSRNPSAISARNGVRETGF